ncbi:MAG: Ig-like domain-containing protein, partial [Thermoanaerobaculia bacterium]
MKRLLFLAIATAFATTTHAAQWMASTESFLCENCEATPAAYAKLRAANVRTIRYFVPWPLINPEPGVYDWTQTDRELDAIAKSGLTIYANITGAPAHASENKPTYAVYTAGCTVFDNETWVRLKIGNEPQPDNGGPLSDDWARKDTFVVPRGGSITIPAPGVLANDGRRGQGLQAVTNWKPLHGTLVLNKDGSFTYTHDGSNATEDGFRYWVWGLGDGIHFAADDYEYCAKPAHIDPAKVREFMAAFIDRYGDKVDLYGIWNEPGLSIYWPPTHVVSDPFERLRDEVIVPFVETVRAKDPSAKIVGPECDSGYCLDSVLSLEREAGARWYDVISFHPYPWEGDFVAIGSDNWVDAAVHRIDYEFKPF